MPNWCYNSMVVAGNKKELRKFVKDIRANKEKDDGSVLDTQYSLNQLVPLDPRASVTQTLAGGMVVSSFATMESEGFDGYQHALERWGSKWGACSVEVDDESAYPLHIRFDSAWSPAEKLIINISELYPKLAFAYSYEEEGFEHCGWTIISGGAVVESYDARPDRLPMWLKELEQKASDEDTSEAWEEYYETHNEWRHEIRSRVDADADTVLAEFVVWRRKADRQRKEGRYVESFIPSV